MEHSEMLSLCTTMSQLANVTELDERREFTSKLQPETPHNHPTLFFKVACQSRMSGNYFP